MKPYKVLHVTNISVGGVGVVFENLVLGLNKGEFESIAASTSPFKRQLKNKLLKSNIKFIEFSKYLNKTDANSNLSYRLRKIGKRVEKHLGIGFYRFFSSLKDFQKFLIYDIPKIKLFMQIIRKCNIDLVHTHNNMQHGKPEIFASWLSRIPCISHYHQYTQLTFIDKMLCRRLIDSFVYISNDLANYHFSQGIPRTKVTIIHNGIDTQKFSFYHDKSIICKEFGCNTNDFLIGLIARIDWWKGQDYFIEAIGEVVKIFPHVKGLIIGGLAKAALHRNQEYLNNLHSKLKHLGLHDKFIFTGYINDIPRIIGSLDLVVHASSEPEPFGLTVIEGMAAGKPVIATAAGGILDIIEDGVNGLLVPCRNSKALAHAMLKLIRYKDIARNIGSQGRLHVRENFSVERQVSVVQKLYNDLLGIY